MRNAIKVTAASAAMMLMTIGRGLRSPGFQSSSEQRSGF